MAQANRGYGLKHCGGLLDDNRQRVILFLHADDGLAAAKAPGAVYDSVFPEALLQQIADACAQAGDLERIRALGVKERTRERADPNTIFGSMSLFGLEDRRKWRYPR